MSKNNLINPRDKITITTFSRTANGGNIEIAAKVAAVISDTNAIINNPESTASDVSDANIDAVKMIGGKPSTSSVEYDDLFEYMVSPRAALCINQNYYINNTDEAMIIADLIGNESEF